MKKLIFEDIDDLVVFYDSECVTDFYGMNKETLIEKKLIMRKYNFYKPSIPDDLKLKVFRIGLQITSDKSNFIYKPMRNEIVEFPLKRIINVWLQPK